MEVLAGSVSIFGCEVDKLSKHLPLKLESDGSKAMILSVKNTSLAVDKDFKFNLITVKAG